MEHHLQAVKITDTVYWVGAIDWNVRNFHGYQTKRGTTYNAFLLLAEKITLIDTVKKGFFPEMVSRISSLIDPGKIEYIISNHSEPDHSGTLPQAVKQFNPEKLFASKMGARALSQHFDFDMEITQVKDGQELSLGNKNVTFIETRMLHWPDSMFTYLTDDKILFSQDAFGMHLASSERFDDDLPWELLERQAESYYANIITLYSPQVSRLLTKVSDSGLEFDMIVPDHGPIFRKKNNISRILDLYKKWSDREVEKKAVIIYDTMWQATETMARHIEDGLVSRGLKVELMCMSSCDRSEVADEVLNAAAVIIGSPTLNNNLLPSIADVLTYLKGLKFKTPFAAAFGSYGWSGESLSQIKEYLDSMDTEFLGEVKSIYSPGPEQQKACYDLGLLIAKRIFDKMR